MTSSWWGLASAHLRYGERSLAAAHLPIGAAEGLKLVLNLEMLNLELMPRGLGSAQIRLRRRRLRNTKMRPGASSNPRILLLRPNSISPTPPRSHKPYSPKIYKNNTSTKSMKVPTHRNLSGGWRFRHFRPNRHHPTLAQS